MLVRRLAVLVAVVAAGVLPTSAATAAGTKCVALVVDASAFGAGVSSSCVTVAADASGSDVLAKGGHHVTFDKRYGDNFVCAIDGRPAGGCHATDSTHYWVYYHRPAHASSWQVSTEGAGTYQPANASTEGWVYDNGASTAPRPANVPYSSICRQTATASPTPTPTRTHPSSMATATATAKPKATVTATTVTSPPTPSSSPTSARAVSKPTRTVRAATPLTSPLLSTTPSSAPPTPVAAGEPAPTKHHGFPTGLVAAIGAVVVVGAAAAARSRRSPR